jgi:UDP-N-acetylmuramoylalanine--D-glutamate ligase
MKGEKVTVIGLGNSGLNAALLLKGAGADVRVTEAADNEYVRKSAAVLDKNRIRHETGSHTKGFIEGSSLAVISPGVENTSDAVMWAREFGIPIIAEMELGYRYCSGKIIAITGTNGKSTVTALTGEMLKDAGLDTVVCGNIGNSLCGEIGRIGPHTWVVLEVSSFQLERTVDFKPRISVILNITDDHMDRYAKFSDYFDEKLKIFRNQDSSDTVILNRDAKELAGLEGRSRARTLYYSRLVKTEGSYIENGKVLCAYGGSTAAVCRVEDIRLKGLHNVENVLVSALIAVIAGASAQSIKRTVSGFNGLSHRFETVATIDDVEYVDDSKGTTVDSTYRALESCARPVVLIAGGKDKMSDYGVIKDIVEKKVTHVVLIGEARARIRQALGPRVSITEAATMKGAVEAARMLAQKDNIVLLSPMCSSFDMFSSYKERGEAFRDAVLALKGSA